MSKREIKKYMKERAKKKSALEKKLKRKLTDAEYAAHLINSISDGE